MKMQNAMTGRILGLMFIVVAATVVSRGQSLTWIGDFSNMTVGQVRTIRAEAYDGSWDFPDHVTMATSSGPQQRPAGIPGLDR